MADFKEIEQRWQKEWEKAKIFEVKEDSKKKKYYVLEMFPYPSASGLHMGHAFNYTIGDVYARFKRMSGFNVLYPMGYDAFGLPAENAAIKAKSHPKKFTDEAVANFVRQQKELGMSYDWSRIIKTCEPEYYRWNQYFFLRFLEKGLAYRKKAAVNWCPKCESVLANEQVHNGKCWRHEDTEVEIKQLEQWFIKTTNYSEELLNTKKLEWPERIKIMQENWIGKSYGTEIQFDISGKKWNIFTTRPDTIYGVTFMVVSAQHPRLMELAAEKQKKDVEKFLAKIKSTSEKDAEALEKEGVFTGSYAVNPLTNERVPVYAGNFVVADYGSGMIMAVPAHDQRDWEFAKKYKIPIKEVIKDKTKVITIPESLNNEFYKEVEKFAEIVNRNGLSYIYTEKIDDVFKLAKNNFVGSPWYIHSEGEIKKILFYSGKECKIFDYSKENNKAKRYGLKIGIKKEQLDYDALREAFTEEGVLINSGKFSGLMSSKAIEEITKFLESKKLGKKAVNYKFRDWLISRQRYWGTPIPVVYCEKCGIVPVPEKELPVLLPKNVNFGKGNPLTTSRDFVETKCPKCKGKAKRETDTMDTFFDSSWYFLRYCDPKNSREPFDKKKAEYWMPVDQYVGGAEHACMHLIYARFFTKVLRDFGFLKFGEPFSKLFNQGMLHGFDGVVMSKSRGNVVLPEDVSKKYGIDAARLFLMSQAAPDKDTQWNENGIEGSLKILNKILDYFSNFKPGKSSEIIESKINKTIREFTQDIENFRYNLGIIKLRVLFEAFENENQISRKDAESFLKMLHLFCPHITEELWHEMGNKEFISLEKWPKADESKINPEFEKQEQACRKLTEDIKNIIGLLKEKQSKDVQKVYVYALPKEKGMYDKEFLKKKLNLEIEIYSVADKGKYDPQGKAGRAKPGKPAIYAE